MNDPARTAALIGGPAKVGRAVASGLDLARAVRHGLSVGAADHLVATGRLSLAELDRVVMPRRTLANRRKTGTLTAEQSDRLIRAARVLAWAEETFGAPEKAALWLRRPSAALGGEPPLDLLDTEEGARAVERLLGRIDHGLAA